jgi:hypothetical protein
MVSHDELVSRAVALVQTSDRGAIVRAFAASLSTRSLPARSTFGSLMVLQNFKTHPFKASEEFSDSECGYCGLTQAIELFESDERIANYPFQVQHTDIEYATFDLATFAERDVNDPTEEDIDCLRNLLDALRGLPATAQLTELNKSIGKAIKSNKHERMILLETFGYAGILCPKTKQHYAKKFVTYDEANSDQPREFYKREWAYPVRFWTGKDGVNDSVVRSLFGKLL